MFIHNKYIVLNVIQPLWLSHQNCFKLLNAIYYGSFIFDWNWWAPSTLQPSGHTKSDLNRVKTSKVFPAKLPVNPFVTLGAHLPRPTRRYSHCSLQRALLSLGIELSDNKETSRMPIFWPLSSIVLLMAVMQCVYCVIWYMCRHGILQSIMTSSNRSIFHVTLLMCGEPPITVDSHHKGTVTRTFDISLLAIWTNCWTNVRLAGNSRRHDGQLTSP